MADKSKQRTRALMALLPGWSYQSCWRLRQEHADKSNAEIAAIVARNEKLTRPVVIASARQLTWEEQQSPENQALAERYGDQSFHAAPVEALASKK